MRPCNGLSVGVAKLEKRKEKNEKRGEVVWEKNAYIKKIYIFKNKNKNKRKRQKQRKKSAHIKKKKKLFINKEVLAFCGWIWGIKAFCKNELY